MEARGRVNKILPVCECFISNGDEKNLKTISHFERFVQVNESNFF